METNENLVTQLIKNLGLWKDSIDLTTLTKTVENTLKLHIRFGGNKGPIEPKLLNIYTKGKAAPSRRWIVSSTTHKFEQYLVSEPTPGCRIFYDNRMGSERSKKLSETIENNPISSFAKNFFAHARETRDIDEWINLVPRALNENTKKLASVLVSSAEIYLGTPNLKFPVEYPVVHAGYLRKIFLVCRELGEMKIMQYPTEGIPDYLLVGNRWFFAIIRNLNEHRGDNDGETNPTSNG